MSRAAAATAAALALEDLARRDSPLHRLEARAKLVPALAAIACAALADQASAWKLAAIAALAILAAAASRTPLLALARRVLVLLPFAAFFALTAPLLPIPPEEAAARAGLIVAKAATSLLVATTLAATTRWHELLEGLAGIGVPRALALVLHFLHRYLFVLAGEVAAMRRARDARLCGPLGARAALASGASMIGALFIRSVERAERIEAAMASRGFAGEWRTLGRKRFGARDAAALALGVGAVAAVWAA